MIITVAKTAGFCFGVNRAVNMVYGLLNKNEKVTTLGELIHNPQFVETLGKKGVKIANDVSECNKGETVVIRSHGVTADVYNKLNEGKINYVDATCPYVAKIHKLVRETECDYVLIAGNENHPEVEGIKGHSKAPVFVFNNAESLENIIKKIGNNTNKRILVVSQTTFSVEEWEKCHKIIKKVYTNAVIFDTICRATNERQKEAERLAKDSDLVVVIGGRHSSNTAKLKDVCSKYCRTVLIEQASELFDYISKDDLLGNKNIGITAGASTPASIIKEVVTVMTNTVNEENKIDTKEKSFDEMSFEEALEASFKNLNTGERVHGVVVGVTPTEVLVDVGRKQTGYIIASELSNDPSAKPQDLVKVGDEMDLLIMKTNDQEGTIMLSRRRIQAAESWDKIVDANENDEVVEGVVKEVIKGGVLVYALNSRIFIPASQSGVSRKDSLDSLLNQTVQFKIIEVNTKRRRAVGSIRQVTKAANKKIQEEFWAGVEVGKKYTGKVKSITSYGAFVDLGGVDGMVHVSELSWQKIKSPSDVVKEGDVLEVYIKDIDTEKKRISLGYKKSEDNPWEQIKTKCAVGDVITGKIVGLTDFGAFVSVIPGIDGFIHVSQISDHRVNKPADELKVGQEIQAKIMDIDFDKKRVSLSIRELLSDAKSNNETAEDNND